MERDHSFNEVELVSETAFKRIIKFKEGPKLDKIQAVHPPGVAWGSMYPRLFESFEKPADALVFRGRVLVKQDHGDKVNAIPDVDPTYRFQPFVATLIDSINAAEPVLLSGGAGVGKTTSVLQLAAKTNHPVLRANFNGETRLSDFLGKMTVVNGQTLWVDGILPMAMKNGYWLILDEIDFADPAILSLLHPVLEENSILVLKENNGEIIKPHTNFRIFGTANSVCAMQDRSSNFTGTNQMNEAFMDRWQVLLIPNLNQKEELKIVRAKVKGLKNRWAKKIVEFANKVRSRELEGFEFGNDAFSTRRVIAWAKKTALLRSPVEGAKLSWLDKVPSGDQDVLLKILDTHFGSNKRVKKEKVVDMQIGKKPRKKRTPKVSSPTTPPSTPPVV